MLAETIPPKEYSLPGVLHYIQAEWRRFERERNEWTIEQAELKARIALLEGERRGVESLKGDLIKRVKMLEYALRRERERQLVTQPSPKTTMDGKISSDTSDQASQLTYPVDISSKTPTPDTMADIKLREKSRQALKTCLQEINYLTSIPTKMPLTYSLANSVRSNSMKNANRMSTSSISSTSSTTSRNGPTTKTPTTKSVSTPKSPSRNYKSTTDDFKATEDNSAGGLGANRQSPPLPPSDPAPIDNVDEVEMFNNGVVDKTLAANRDSVTLTEADNEELSKKMQEKYNLSNERVQKMMKSINKGTKKSERRSPEPQETDLSSLGPMTKNYQNDTPKLWKTKLLFKGHLDSVRAVAFHPSDMLFATGSDDGTVKVVDLQRNTNTDGGAKKSQDDLDANVTYRGHNNIVTSVAISGEQNRVYSASLDSTIRVWRLPSEQHGTFSPVDPSLYITTFVGHTDAIWDFKLSLPSSSTTTWLASASADGKVKLWDTQGYGDLLKHSWTYQGTEHDNHVAPTCVDFCRTDVNKLVVSYNNAKIQLFDLETGKLVSTFTGSDDDYDSTPNTQINKVVSHPTMPIVISGHEDRQVRFFDINSGKCTFNMSAHLDAVTSLDMDPNGMAFVSGGHDASIRLWDMAMTKTCLQEFSAHRKKGDEGVLDIQYHRAYPWMVSGGADGIVKVYYQGQ
ncbi:WD40-repeat-containing domain protein [Chlamydoabsidia padenii]|nr:WD40-repeat-containing domain protein [Chlamydoabsidia padenii]